MIAGGDSMALRDSLNKIGRFIGVLQPEAPPMSLYDQNGYPIDDVANSGYSEQGFSTSSEMRSTGWIEGSPTATAGEVTTAGTYNMYCRREARFYISVTYNGAWIRQGERKTNFLFGAGMDGGPGYDAPQGGYLLRKKHHPDHNSLKRVDPYRPGVLYRLGEAYLNYVECALECAAQGIDNSYFDEAMDCWDKIRERAGLPGIRTLYPGANLEKLMELYKKERRVELNNEGCRWRDIRRWKIGEQTLDRTFDGMNFNGTAFTDAATDPDAFFKRTPYFTRVFKKQFYFFPVPSWEMDKNPNLRQNPYWN